MTININYLPSNIRHQLTEYLFLNVGYLLKKHNEHIHYGHPQYSSAKTGFTIFIFRVSFETYHYVIRCIESLGCTRIIRECGTTIAALSNTPEENIALRNQFMLLLDEAEKQLILLGGKTPQEYYALKTNPVIIDIYNTDHEHFVVLEADLDPFSRLIWGELGFGKIIENVGIDGGVEDGCKKILVRFYKKGPRDRFVRYLRRIGVPDGLVVGS
ncbi:MAG: hypothetical protein KJ630_14660 [Proteobacteria bacterium]|nr:hypothetical protein [Pseudomonadota bacterium]